MRHYPNKSCCAFYLRNGKSTTFASSATALYANSRTARFSLRRSFYSGGRDALRTAGGTPALLFHTRPVREVALNRVSAWENDALPDRAGELAPQPTTKTMPHNFGSLVFTPLVKALQEQHGSRRQYARLEASDSSPGRLGPEESAVHRGPRHVLHGNAWARPAGHTFSTGAAPKGFLKVIDESTIAFADFRRQQAIHQYRQSDERQPGGADPDGLSQAVASENSWPRRDIRRRSGAYETGSGRSAIRNIKRPSSECM